MSKPILPRQAPMCKQLLLLKMPWNFNWKRSPLFKFKIKVCSESASLPSHWLWVIQNQFYSLAPVVRHLGVVVQSQIPEWLAKEILSLPITTPQENPPAASNSTRLNDPEPFNSLGDPDSTNPRHVGSLLIQVCYSANFPIWSQYLNCLRVEYRNGLPPSLPHLSPVML